MYAVIYTIGMVVLWVANLFNGTGLGSTYKTTEITMVVMVVLAVLCLATQSLKDGDLYVKPKYFYTLLPLVLVFFGLGLLRNTFSKAVDCLWEFLIVYVLSKTRPNHVAVRMTAIYYAVLGLVILLLFNYTDFFKGWNTNTIGMIGLFSFLIFTIPFFGMREWRSFIMMPLVGVAYVVLILPTGSRSCIFVVFVQLLLTLRIIPSRKLVESAKGLTMVLLIPLFVAIAVVLFAAFGDVSGLTEWSYETFNKPLFNGRDMIWLEGFKLLKGSLLIGPGKYNTGYWHNSAMTCLAAAGVVGYYFWLRLQYLIIGESRTYLDDICVMGSVIAYLVLAAQQAVELGLFAINASFLPYVILGILLGRINCIKQEQRYAQS